MAYIKWNGFTLSQNVRFKEYTSTPVYAEDGLQHVTTRHNIKGTGLINYREDPDSGADTETNFNAALVDARARLLRPRNASSDFVIAYGTDVGPGTEPAQKIIDLSSGTETIDQFEGPLGEFQVDRIFGARAAMVAFDITWHDYDTISGEVSQEVIGHRWTQRWVIDRDGMSVRTTVGVLVVRADASTADAEVKGPNPDFYRGLVMPDLPPGFRRERADFVGDDAGIRLVYRIEDKEYARDLPAPAYSGNGQFIYRRSLGGELGILGQKTFVMELTGARNVSPSQLYDAIIKITRSRIDYNRDIIELIQVDEPLFDTNTVQVRVVARATSGGDLITPPNFDLWNDILSGVLAGAGKNDPQGAPLPGYDDKSPYGSGLLASVKRGLYLQTDTELVTSQTGGLYASETTSPSAVASVPKADHVVGFDIIVTPSYNPDAPEFAPIVEDMLNAPDGNIVDQTHENHIANPYVAMRMVETVKVIDSGMRLSRPQSLNGADRPMQIRRPIVHYTQEGTMSRLGKSPEREFRPPPPGAILMEAQWQPSIGMIDGVNTHIFSVSYRVKWQLTDLAPSMRMQAGFGGDFAHFWPTSQLAMPNDQRLDPAAQNAQGHVFVGGAYRYQTGVNPGISTALS